MYKISYFSITFDAERWMVHVPGHSPLEQRGHRQRWNRTHTSFINLELDGASCCRRRVRIGREKLVGA